MRRAFTLIELLVTIGIMGLLGTMAVGGYRAMVRGMEERGVIDNVNSFVRAAYQRAQIDRQPVIVYFWNETVMKDTDTEIAKFAGKAIAVRRAGRLTKCDGSLLVDEFADWRTEGSNGSAAARGRGSTMAIYAMDLAHKGCVRSLVYSDVEADGNNVPIYLCDPKTLINEGKLDLYGYRVATDTDPVGAAPEWKAGMSYGFEFQRLELPIGYIFGTSKPKDDKSVQYVKRFAFDVGKGEKGKLTAGGIVEGGGTIPISALRQKGVDYERKDIGESSKPDVDMNQQ